MTHSYAQALAEFSALTDSRTGIIRGVDLIRLSESDPVAYIANAEPSDTTPLVGLQAANRGVACSASAERAIVRACGESVERYCSAFFDTDSLLRAADAELEASGRAYIPTERFYPFAAWQYAQPGFPFAPTTGRTVRWIEGTSAMSGRPALIPASCVYVPYLFDSDVEPFTHMPISTGLAAGRDVDQCIAKGMLEILERDALMIVWHGELEMPRLDPETCLGRSPLIDDLLAAGLGGSIDWFLNVLTLDVDVTIISAALIDRGSPPLTSFGISADPDPERALLLALEEAMLTRILVNRLDEAREERDPDPAAVQTLHAHLVAHAASPRLRERLGFLTNAPEIAFGELLQQRTEAGGERSVVERVAAAGLDAYWVDVTTEDVAEFGFHVIRTVMPGMQPLDNDHRYPHVGGSRRVTVPRALGLGTPTEATINPDPHPFP
jgi:ribosomal protein S12 methylthiotransferase accessory factor